MGVSLTSLGWTAGICRQVEGDGIGTLVKYGSSHQDSFRSCLLISNYGKMPGQHD